MQKSDFWAATFVSVTSLVVYSLTICRTVYVGDSGELALAASQLQIAHPPGYPLLILLGRVWTLILGFLRPILALNILSALFASATTFLFYRFVKRFTNRPGIVAIVCPASIALAFAFSHVVWFHAASFEVHTLSALLIVTTILAISKALESGDLRYLILATYSTGLALTNHLSAVALLPALILVVMYRRRSLRFSSTVLLALALLLPFSAYLYLVFRSSHDLVLTWYNPQSWVGLKQHVFAEAYQRYLELINWRDIPAYFATLRETLSQQFFLPWVIPSLLGFIAQLRRSRSLAIATVLIVVVNIALNSSYGISDIEAYFIPTIIVLMIWLAELLSAIVRRSEFLTALAALLAVAFGIAAMVGNWSACNLSENSEAEIYANEMFGQVPQGGILICGSDNSTFSTLYLRYVEQRRPDIEVYGQLPTLVRLQRDVSPSGKSGWGYFPELLKTVVERRDRPVVLAQEPMNFDNDFHQFGIKLYPSGLVYHLSPGVAEEYLHPPLRLANEIPGEITDPKLARLYTLYSLAAANDAIRYSRPTSGKYFRQAESIIMAEEEPNLYGALVAWFIAEDRMAQAQRVAEAALELPTLRQSERQRLDLALARIALRTDEHEAARTYFEDVLQVSPDHVEANFQLLALDAADAEKGGDLSLAIGLYERMVQLAPDQMQSFYRLGRLQLQLGDTSAAVSAFQNCISNGYRRAELVTLVQSLTDQ